MFEAEANGPPAEEGVEFFRQIERTQELIAAEVERADDRGMRVDRFGDGPVGCVLLLLIRKIGLVEVEKLGAIEADSFGAILLHEIEILRQFDIG